MVIMRACYLQFKCRFSSLVLYVNSSIRNYLGGNSLKRSLPCVVIVVVASSTGIKDQTQYIFKVGERSTLKVKPCTLF